MNKIIPVSTEYLRPSRTIEILNLVRFEDSKVVYVYNFEGIHFRLFDSLAGLIRYFESGDEPEHAFDSEDRLDAFLEQYPIGDPNLIVNLRMDYMYRDGANYKQFHSIVFSNKQRMSPQKATEKMREKMINGEFFKPKDWGLKNLHAHPYDPEIDHEWHELEGFECTKSKATSTWDISEFLGNLENQNC